MFAEAAPSSLYLRRPIIFLQIRDNPERCRGGYLAFAALPALFAFVLCVAALAGRGVSGLNGPHALPPSP